MDYLEFGNKLSQIRKEKKISQSQLANDIGLSRATISSFENARGVEIGLKKILKLVDYLGYEIVLKEKSNFPTFEELRDGK